MVGFKYIIVEAPVITSNWTSWIPIGCSVVLGERKVSNGGCWACEEGTHGDGDVIDVLKKHFGAVCGSKRGTCSVNLGLPKGDQE